MKKKYLAVPILCALIVLYLCLGPIPSVCFVDFKDTYNISGESEETSIRIRVLRLHYFLRQKEDVFKGSVKGTDANTGEEIFDQTLDGWGFSLKEDTWLAGTYGLVPDENGSLRERTGNLCFDETTKSIVFQIEDQPSEDTTEVYLAGENSREVSTKLYQMYSYFWTE